MVKQIATIHVGQGDILDLYELPNGQWQFGTGRDAKVVEDISEVEKFGDGIVKQVSAWLEKVKALNLKPAPMQAGNMPAESSAQRLKRRLDSMSPEMQERILLAIENSVGPADDSITAGEGVEEEPLPIGSGPFTLPEGAEWADDRNPANGYFTINQDIKDARGNATRQWHPTPEFHQLTDGPDSASTVDAYDPAEADIELERQRQSSLVGAAAAQETRSSRSKSKSRK